MSARRTRAHEKGPDDADVDVATRRRLLDAAKRLFAERGFAEVSVREICREANANLALVNYYFGDKGGLYLEVIDEALALVNDFNAQVMQAPENSTPEERLTRFVRMFVERVLQRDEQHTWVHRLINQEMTRANQKALTRIAAEAIAPRVRYLASVIADLLDCSAQDPLVTHCVASVHGLCLVYARLNEVPRAMTEAVAEVARFGKVNVEDIAAHVAAFALAGIRAMRKEAPSRGARRGKRAPRRR